MNASEFIEKWSKSEIREKAGFQSYFNDLCDLVSHSKPAEADSQEAFFVFEKTCTKLTGVIGFADVWYSGHFAWEQKGKHKNLMEAYHQLLDYRDSLGNPPLLVVSDFDTIEIHTNFTNTQKKVHRISLNEIENSIGIIEALFYEPDTLKPEAVEISNPAILNSQLNIRFRTDGKIGVSSSYGMYTNIEPCPPLEGEISLEIVLANESHRSAKSIKVDVDICELNFSRPDCSRHFYISGNGWYLDSEDQLCKHYHFDGSIDDICLGKDELLLGTLVFDLTLPKEARELKRLHQEVEADPSRELSVAFKKVAIDLPGQLTWIDEDFQKRILIFYEEDPAQDLYSIRFRVRAEGFAPVEGEVVLSLIWSNRKGSVELKYETGSEERDEE